jgi:hypothetical protein
LAGCTQADTARAPEIQSATAFPPDADAALRLVNRFIDAESVGNWWGADSLVAWRACARDRTTDSLMVTTVFQVQAAAPIGDSALVRVIYDMAGRVWLAAPPIAGPQRTRFAAGGSRDTVIYRVFADSMVGGRLRLACGAFRQNHVAVSQLRDFVRRFDDSAQAAWQAVFPKQRRPRRRSARRGRPTLVP